MPPSCVCPVYTSWLLVKQGNGPRVTMGDLSISHCALRDSDRHVFSSGTYVGELSPRMSVAPVL